MTSPNLTLSSAAGPCPQALAAASSVVRYSGIDRRFLQSSTEYLVALYFAKASEGGGRNRASRPLQISSTPGLAMYPARSRLLSWLVHQSSASPRKHASSEALSLVRSLVWAATCIRFVKEKTFR